MTKAAILNLTQNIGLAAVQFTNADAALTAKQLLVAGVDDEVVKAIQIVSDDPAARVVDLLLTVGVVDVPLCSVNVPANSGANGVTAAVDALAAALHAGLPLDALGKRVLPLKGLTVLKVRNQTQVAAAKTLSITAITEKF
ncbi:MAG: hypothetical protein JWQ72_3200 [Polaromonas sp.]|nr:hypothetical protein [Polaromonas sp.]